MNSAGLLFLLLLLLVILPAGAWIGWTRWRAHKQGLPPPPLSAYNPFNRKRSNSSYANTSSSKNPLHWIQDKFSSLRGARSSGGAYHGASNSRGFGPLDPDGAWDDRVGLEAERLGPGADYEEAELGLQPPAPGPYGGSGYGAELPAYGEERGRSRSRDDTGYIGGSQRGLDRRYDEEMHGSHGEGQNPFGEHAERSDLRGVSPRPVEDHHLTLGKTSTEGSRKSIFHESME